MSGTGPAVTVDLNSVIGNEQGRLKFGGHDFSKVCCLCIYWTSIIVSHDLNLFRWNNFLLLITQTSKNISVVERGQSNWLMADVLNKQGNYAKSELKLDGSLQITIPAKHHAPDPINSESCGNCFNACSIM